MTHLNCPGKIRSLLIVFLVTLSVSMAFSQSIPTERRVDWTIAGAKDTSTANFQIINLREAGFIGDGVTANDRVIDSLLQHPSTPGMILHFPAGTFLFHRGLRLPSNCVLRGEGAEFTRLLFDLGGSGHAISVTGRAIAGDTTQLQSDAPFGGSTLLLADTAVARTGDWLFLTQSDEDRVLSEWAVESTGQIVMVNESRNGSTILSSPLRQSYEQTRRPHVTRLQMESNAGIECLAIERVDNTAPEQSCSVFFRYAQNCWVRGVEIFKSTFAHIGTEFSSNISVDASYLHHAFEYGGGGRGYGVVLQFATGECRIENNIFERLRHSMLLQAGPNGNVFAYNYSFDPYWSDSSPLVPSDAAGDIVLHGNYPYVNLFEHNICRNIVIDNSHGANGPFNTFFRNRAEGFGVFFSANNSPSCNIVGNEIPNTAMPYSLVNYTILGNDHFILGNNNKGQIVPDGDASLPDSSYAYVRKPHFLQGNAWASIGIPNVMGSGSVPAFERYNAGQIFAGVCDQGGVSTIGKTPDGFDVSIFPNPSRTQLTVAVHGMRNPGLYRILDLSGRTLLQGSAAGPQFTIDVTLLRGGTYFLVLPTLGTFRFLISRG
ncbi:MAG: glycosyl hydrolase family 28-related protein [Bacteroidota bacterium]